MPGRSLLANVVDVETEAMHQSMEQEAAALILFDFAAAFPSISQEYIFEALQHLGVPEAAQRLVKSLYYEHYGTPTLEGQVGQPIPLTAGLRQGCPLSPLLFVLAVDSLLRRAAAEGRPPTSMTSTRTTATTLANTPSATSQVVPILAAHFHHSYTDKFKYARYPRLHYFLFLLAQ